jgi:hypothetical protein
VSADISTQIERLPGYASSSLPPRDDGPVAG